MHTRSESLVSRETRSTPAGPVEALVILEAVDVGTELPAGTVLEPRPEGGHPWRATIAGDEEWPDGFGVPGELVQDLIRMDDIRRQPEYRVLHDSIGLHASDFLTDAPTVYAALKNVPEAGIRKGDGILHLPCAVLSRPTGFRRVVVKDLTGENLDAIERAASPGPLAVNVSPVWDAFRFRPDLAPLLRDREAREWSIVPDDYGPPRPVRRASAFLHVRPIVSSIAEQIEAQSETAALWELVARTGGRLDP